MDFRFHRHVTSGDVITPPFPCEGSGNTLGDSRLRSRIYPTPCFFESMATHARGLGRSLRFTHAQTYSVTATAKGLGSHRPIVCCFLIGRNGSSEQIDDVSNASKEVTQKTIALLSFLRSDWSLPSLAICTTKLFKYLFLLTANGDIN